MKNITNKLFAFAVAAAFVLLACVPLARAGQFMMPSLIRGTQMVLTNTQTYTNAPWYTNTTTPMVFTPLLSEQYPVGFGGGTNWWANGWTYYTNTSGIIVTNPLPLLQTNLNWWASAQYYGNSALASPTVGCFLSVQSGLGTNGTSSTTNGITITLASGAGTNYMSQANNQFTFTFTWTGTNLVNIVTNLPSFLVQNGDRIIPYQITALGTNAVTVLDQLTLTVWNPSAEE